MHIDVNGTRLWFDVDGPALVPDGPSMRERPTLVLIHGGPGGYDHSYFKPDFARLRDVAQLVYLDLRGLGRSARVDPDDWSLELCADDVASFCDALGIEQPVLLGHSMGGFVALLHAIRHPGAAGGLVLLSTVARWDQDRLADGFRAVADDRIAEIARRDFAGEPVSDDETASVFAAFGPNVPDPDELARRIGNDELGPPGMALVRKFDVTDQLHGLLCPTLVIVGDKDPVTSVDGANEIMATLPVGIGHRAVIHGAGHFPWLDAPDQCFKAIAGFVEELAD
jgi:pimeloyl-ACP methyl ester carboxylesterase